MSYGPLPRSRIDFRVDALFRRLGHSFGEVSELGAYGEDDPRGYVETVLHEIAHVVVLRHGVRAALRYPLRTSIGEAVPNFPDVVPLEAEPAQLTPQEFEQGVRLANEHEIDTIAVEVIASHKIGLPFDPMDIAVFAVDGENVRDMNADECCTRIERAMKRREVRRWGNGLGRYLANEGS